jgi:3-oxoacyl-[acyl-carrier-protein] synthase II
MDLWRGGVALGTREDLTVGHNDNARPERVVVTGLGVASPLGVTVESFWSQLLAGRSGVARNTDGRLSTCRTQVFGRVPGFEPEEYFSQRDLRRLSRTSQLALVATSQALAQAGMDQTRCREIGMGAIVGGSSGGFEAVEPVIERFIAEGFVRDPLTVPLVMNNAPASNMSITFGLTGPVMTIDAACASSTHAIGHAYILIRDGRLASAIVGGADDPLGPSVVHAWSSLRALTERNDRPQEACRPFSLDRDGTVLAEGAGMLVLESERMARERGAAILAEVSGYGASSDAHHLTKPHAAGICSALERALDDAGLTPADIDYINAHGTGTRQNDLAETQAIKQVLGPRAHCVPVVSIKAAIGHAIAASGAIECVSCVLSLRDQVVPPTLNVKVPDPQCDLDYVNEGARPCTINHLLRASFAFGGSNAVLVLSRYERED